MAKPAARKSSPESPKLRTPAHGRGALRVGNPGNAGGGRPPDAFKALCRQLASGETTVAQVKRILKNDGHPQFIAALKWATENGYGKPKESIEHSGSVTLEQILADSHAR